MSAPARDRHGARVVQTCVKHCEEEQHGGCSHEKTQLNAQKFQVYVPNAITWQEAEKFDKFGK